uniref:Uncharacterized protein n=1 Tax=Caenorhabditis japonica TaxID=281687 RepID=A0A8R1EBD8_CAEJA
MGTRDVESKKFRTNGLEPQRLFPAGMLSESCGEIRVKNVRMLTSVDASGDITHHYSVTWSEPGQNAKKAEVKKKEKDKKEDVMGVVPTSVVTTPITTTSSTTASTVSVKKLASQKKIQEGLKRGGTHIFEFSFQSRGHLPFSSTISGLIAHNCL